MLLELCTYIFLYVLELLFEALTQTSQTLLLTPTPPKLNQHTAQTAGKQQRPSSTAHSPL